MNGRPLIFDPTQPDVSDEWKEYGFGKDSGDSKRTPDDVYDPPTPSDWTVDR